MAQNDKQQYLNVQNDKQMELKDKFLKAIRENSNGYGMHPHEEVFAALDCERIAIEEMIKVLEEIYDDEDLYVISDRLSAKIQELKKQRG